MPDHQHTTPLMLKAGEVTRLTRVSFTEKHLTEGRLQKLLFEHPELVPVEEIEPVFAPLCPVGREVRTADGPLDLLYINPEGFITLAETKLWRNPQARREVIAQLIDYAQVHGAVVREVVRAIVEVRGELTPKDVRVTIPPDSTRLSSTRSITEDEYYDRLRTAAGAEAVEFVKAIIEAAPEHDLEVTWSTRGPALRYVHEATGHKFKLARFGYDGTFHAGAFDRACAKAGIPRQIAADYLEATRALIPGSVVSTRGEKDMRTLRLPSGDDVPFVTLAKARDRWLAEVDRAVSRIEAALEGGAASPTR